MNHPHIKRYKHKYSASIELMQLLLTNSVITLSHFIKQSSLDGRTSKNYFYQVVRRLYNDGIIEKDGIKKDTKIRIIPAMAAVLKKRILRESHEREKMKAVNQKPQKSTFPIIITYDIPERLRSKRHYLRNVLKSFEYTNVQKSVWIGYYKLPELFIDELRTLGILSYITIFSISRLGTLERQVNR